MNVNLDQALNILKQYSCIEIKTIKSEPEKEQLIEALMLVVNLSRAENLGICASNGKEALTALNSYLKAFGYDFNLDSQSILAENKPLYIKFSTERMSHWVDNYSGDYRGVLITIFSDDNDGIVGTYGHFPLDLFNN